MFVSMLFCLKFISLLAVGSSTSSPQLRGSSSAPCHVDPHCSFQGSLCQCCYNGGCDIQEACRCGEQMPVAVALAKANSSDAWSCRPIPSCSMQQGVCQCCGAGGCAKSRPCWCGTSCDPDPQHCSLEGDRCKCCFRGVCDHEELCRCGAPSKAAASLTAANSSASASGCVADPHCSLHGSICKCCFNGGCDEEELCKCGA